MYRKIIIGQQIKSWMILEKTNKRNSGKSIIWKCQCINCQKIQYYSTSYLHKKMGGICKCYKQQQIAHKKIHMLTFLKPSSKRTSKGEYLWECKCECGKKTLAKYLQVKNGLKKSCGCLVSITSSQLAKQRCGKRATNYIHGKSQTKEYLTKIKRNTYLKSHYGITTQEYNELVNQQNEVCKICHQKETSMFRTTLRKLAVDHDHKTGKIRSLLCQRCNRVLGIVKEDITLLKKLIAYLEYFNA